MFFFNFIICNDRLSLCCDVNIWQNIFNQKIWFGLLSWRYIYCSDRLLWIEFVDFFFLYDFPMLLNLPKFTIFLNMICFTILFYSNENLLLMFYKFFYAISNLPKFITILKKFISPFSMTWNQSCIFFFLLTIQYQYTLYFLIKYFPPV